jgi:hypothetical protein
VKSKKCVSILGKYGVPILTRDNVFLWARLMEAHLRSLDYWTVVDPDGDEPDEDEFTGKGGKKQKRKHEAKCRMACGEILKTASPTVHRKIKDKSSPRSMYKKAIRTVLPKAHTTKFRLMTRITDEKFEGKDEQACNDWLTEREDIQVALEDLGQTVDDGTLAQYAIKNLPKGIKDYIKDYDSRQDLCLDDVRCVIGSYFKDHKNLEGEDQKREMANSTRGETRTEKKPY